MEIRDILDHPRCKDVSAVMMVGGYSESDMLQNAVKAAYH
jgi:phosphoribosylformylglycinamidine (FGAM) synthase-like amidotransferase family enzyme